MSGAGPSTEDLRPPEPNPNLTIQLKVLVPDGDAWRETVHYWRPEVPPGSYLSVLEVLVQNGLPVLRMPFTAHDGGAIHTICSRLDDPDPDEIRRWEM